MPTNQFRYRVVSGSYRPESHYNNKLFSQCRQSLNDLYKLSSWDKYVSAKILSFVLVQVTMGFPMSDITECAHYCEEHVAMQEVPKLFDAFGAGDKNMAPNLLHRVKIEDTIRDFFKSKQM